MMAKTRNNGQLVKTSDFIAKELKVFESEVIKYVSEKTGISEAEAIEALKNDDTWHIVMQSKRKSLDLDMLELVSDFKKSIKEKIEKGSLEQAKAGMTGIAIAYDKVFKSDDNLKAKQSLKIEGSNIQVNIPFNYKDRKKKTKK